ncbi:Cytosolic sorting protein GGA2/TOM1 [Phaffia rhodozyma]|uniref:Cytosolic sorting protein GGA2/TOM1 n=1 Tax=Phaffia rhodozyma TaxID=264483 RepID=A0A0F7SG43_PHARH|nr:Cytosolic sorting protein GGA2/TOM1 [Phaffia rhodozyma]
MYAPRGPSTWGSVSPVQSLVERACEPSLQEPAYTLNLELADYIDEKKANTPREAAVEVVRMVNHRNPHVSVLALHLLDTLVKNCGYPFQLQVGTKEFLNELVRKFPERPPVYPPYTMQKTLELIHEWKNTICVTAKWKEDLVHIRDMHRLLSYKGYRFKDSRANSTSITSQETENLKSPQELEEEDRQMKSAKLQELIRRGKPKDLLAAQELMKDLSGFEPEKAPDYRSQTAKELDKVQAKAILLNDMLNSANENERIGLEGDAYQQVALVCMQARPKIQKWIGEVSEDEPDSMDRLLLINDLINGVIERYEACRKGDWSKGRNIAVSTFTAPPAPEPSLISFDAFADDPPSESFVSSSAALASTSPASVATSTAAPSPPPSFSGLPLDLFSAPAAPSLNLGGSTSGPVNSKFLAGADLTQSQSQAQGTSQMGWGMSSAPAGGSSQFSSGNGGGGGGGISLNIGPGGSSGFWSSNGLANGQYGVGVSPGASPGTGSNAGTQGVTKKDPFEDLLL